MEIVLSPLRMDTTVSVRRDEDALIVNDVRIDLATYKAGDSAWIIGLPWQSDGVWQVRVVFPHGPDAAKSQLYPKPIFVRKNGPIKTPASRRKKLKST